MTLRIRPGRTRPQHLPPALPALGSLAADPLLSMVDIALVGHLGVAPPAWTFRWWCSMAFMVSTYWAYATTAVARSLSSGRAEEIPLSPSRPCGGPVLGITATPGEAAADHWGAWSAPRGNADLFLPYFRFASGDDSAAYHPGRPRPLPRAAGLRTPLITVGVNAVNGLGTTSYLPVGPGVRAPPSPRFASRWGPSFCGEPRGASAVGPRGMAAPARAHARPAPLSPDLASAPSRGTAPTSPLPTAATRMGTWRWPPTRWRWTCGCSWPCDGLAAIAGRRDRPAPGLANRRRPGPLFPHPVVERGSGRCWGGLMAMRGLLTRIFTGVPRCGGIALVFPS